MSYRKLTISDVVYEYAVGRTHTKVKSFGVIKNIDIGEYYWYPHKPCGYAGCHCDPFQYSLNLRVSPKNVASYISSKTSGVMLQKAATIPEGFILDRIYNVADIQSWWLTVGSICIILN